jgi:hypothetical protein
MLVAVLALILGGGGTSNPGTELVLQPLVALLVASTMVVPRLSKGLYAVPRLAWILAALIICIPVLQLIPLPPSVWQALPGRDGEVASLSLIGADRNWMPWSMAPARTFISLLAMAVPALVLLLVSRLDGIGRMWVLGAIAFMGVLSVMVGVLQVSHTGGFTWSFYSYYHVGVVDGFQANHNAQADVISIAMMAGAALCAVRLAAVRNRRMTWIVTGSGLLVIGPLSMIMTGSRTGIALLVVPICAALAMLWPAFRKEVARPGLWLGGGTMVLALVVGGLLAGVGAVQRVLGRFLETTDGRFDIWTDAVFAMKRVWPVGGGVGSFPLLLNAAERLEVVRPTMAGRAHCDWLEWMLEAGAPGVLVLTLILALLAYAGVRAWRAGLRTGAPMRLRVLPIFGTGVLLQLGLHALDDFPMRSMALAILAAIGAAFLPECARYRHAEPALDADPVLA